VTAAGPLPPPLLAVLGHPVAHSLSPVMHEAGFAAVGRAGRYVACDVPPQRLGAAVAGLAALGFAGCNCTVPMKEAALALATRRSPEAERTGAANTLAFRDGEIYADTTDGRGLLAALAEEAGFSAAGRCVLLLGAGGAARGVAAALAGAGAARVVVANRTVPRALRLAADLGGPVCAGEADAAEAARADLIVNCTSVGMDGRALPLSAEALEASGALICDIVYAPAEQTPLLRAARARGLRTVGGIGMLAWQAALAWEVWFGARGPAGVFARAARDALASGPAGADVRRAKH